MNRVFKFVQAFIVFLFMVLTTNFLLAEKTYVVKPGDTLWKIAKEQLGSGFEYLKIQKANKELIKDPNVILVGWKLIIPEIEAELQKEKFTPSLPSCKEKGIKPKLTFLYFNDFHGALEPQDKKRKVKKDGQEVEEKYADTYGIARMAAKVKEIKQINEKQGILTFLIGSGDFLQGSLLSNEFKGEIEAEIFNKIGLSFYTVGNHELDFGTGVLLDFISANNASCVTANYKVDNKYICEPQIKVINGIKIGFAGLVDSEAFTLEKPKVDPQFLKRVNVENEIEKAKKIVEYFKKERVDLIVFCTHIGLDKDKELSKNVKDIDIIIGGDSHTKIDNYERSGNTYIVQAEAYGKFLGKMDLGIKEKDLICVDSELIELNEAVNPDNEVLNFLEEKRQFLKAKLDQVIAENDCFLNGERTSVRSEETNLGDLITDFLKDYFNTDIAIYNGGGIRSSIDIGKVTKGDIYRVLPFSTNNTEVLQISGEILLNMLNYNATQVGKGGFLQVSGLTFELEPNVGVRNVMINGQPLDLNKIYTLATNSFIARGGDGYDMLKNIPDQKPFRAIYGNPAPLLIEYILKNYGRTDKHINYCSTYGRIKILK